MNVLTAHVGHRLTAKDDRHLRCLDCDHTLVMPAGLTVAGSTSTSTAPRRDERCPKHLGYAQGCVGCAADLKAAADDELAEHTARRTHPPAAEPSLGAAAARAALAASRARRQEQTR